MKVNISIEIDTTNEAEVCAVNTCKQYWNLVKAYAPILATKNEAKELFDAIDECKPYCKVNIENQNSRTIYTFAYDDEQKTASASTTDAAASIASLAAELLGSK